jgi:toxin ParE1/3/4
VHYRISKSAERDLDDIFIYWANRASVDIADRILAGIKERFGLLAFQPRIGRKCDEFGTGTRCFPAGQYLVYYKGKRGITSILHVVQGARDRNKALRRVKDS